MGIVVAARSLDRVAWLVALTAVCAALFVLLNVLAVRTVRGLLRHLRDQGVCVLFSSHVMQEVEALCDEIVIIARGRIAASGTPASLRRASGEQNLEEVFVKAIQSPGGQARRPEAPPSAGEPDA